jgi:hypothetical protein
MFFSKRILQVEMIALMNEFNVSPESFYQRITNILQKIFKLRICFFYDFLTKLGRSLSNKKKSFILQINKNHALMKWMSTVADGFNGQ